MSNERSEPAVRPRRAVPFRGWLIAAGVVAVLTAVGVRLWYSPTVDPEPLKPVHAPDPTLLKHEGEIQARVATILTTPPALDEKSPHPVEGVPSNASPELSAFRIVEDHRVYDLRAWKPVGAGDGPHTAGVLMTRTMKLVKQAAADRIDFLTRTSGSDLAVRCDVPRSDAARVFVSQKKPVVSGREMTEHRLSVDVAGVPVGGAFDLSFRTTYWNSLQTPEEQWFGTIGYDGSTLLSMLILFPEFRPFKGGGLRTGPANGDLVPYDGTQLVFKGGAGAWMYWEVPGPKTGNIYRLDWKW
ncbi:hypothetical protein [Limnoglobus roseus]|uniref:Serine/threonine protein kinase n=1 Tax=Limnoglobus roseus TaxID=2598579 RepID=A0A5C1ATW4_9BACT|nr:hypothetical protein [Limnoglobus roseus]QEL21042.1 serine/threonine protein kinase [Limnoglobus roseus]